MKKTKILLILLISLLLFSCNDKEIAELNNRVSELETLNLKLTDSIANVNYKKVTTSEIIGVSSKPTLTVGKKEKVKFIFNYPDELLRYDVYTSTPDGEPDKLILENLKANEFEYEFTPTKLGEERIELIAVFKINNAENEKIYVPINTGFKTSE
jgi:hypothetical protein